MEPADSHRDGPGVAPTSIAPFPDAVSNTRGLIDIRAGCTMTASAAAIVFLWTNWEIFYRVFDSKIKVSRLHERAWHGRGYRGSGEWYLLRAECGIQYGRFEFFSQVRFLGANIRGTSIFEYWRVNAHTIAAQARLWGELPRQLTPLRWLVEAVAARAALRVNFLGSGAASQITAEPKWLQPRIDSSLYSTLLAMMDEEAASLRGDAKQRRYFDLHRPKSESVADTLSALRNDVRFLEQALRDRRSLLDVRELYRSCDLFEIDPKMGVAKIRSLLEPIVVTIYEIEFREPPRKSGMLYEQVRRLYQESKNVPADVTSLMQTIVGLGNISLHAPSSGRAPSRIDANHFKTIFAAMLGVAEWFVQSPFQSK